jgi:hypothetical protein
MLYLLWALLNIGLFLFFIVLCFRATKLLREKTGIVAAIVFVIGLLSFMGNAGADDDNKEPHSNQVKTWYFTSADSLDRNSTALLQVDFDRTLISKYCILIRYAKDKPLKNEFPISASTWVKGLVSGTSWNPIFISVAPIADSGRFNYLIEGTVEWKLLGMTIYTQIKEWKGFALVK